MGLAVFEVEYDYEFTMEFIKKIEQNYLTHFIPEYLENKFIRNLKLTHLPIQKESNEEEEEKAANKIVKWFKSDFIQDKINRLKVKQQPKKSTDDVVRKINAVMYQYQIKNNLK